MVFTTADVSRTPFLPVPNRVAFSVPEWFPLIGGFDIMWYGILVTFGMILGLIILYKKVPGRGIDNEKVWDLGLIAIPCSIVGARLYYVIFEWDNYKDDLSSIFDIRSGGLAIHGGLLFGFGAAMLLFKKWKDNPLDWCDIAVQGLAIGQAIGRWGNYFNSEAHGVATDLPWAIYCDGEFVHPTFLYESVWCFLLCLFLLWFDKHKAKYRGQCVCLYAILYSIERFFVEGLRTDSLWIGQFRQAQIISVCLIIIGIVGLILINKNKDKMLIQRVTSGTKAEESEK